jgi:hypothetical protein
MTSDFLTLMAFSPFVCVVGACKPMQMGVRQGIECSFSLVWLPLFPGVDQPDTTVSCDFLGSDFSAALRCAGVLPLNLHRNRNWEVVDGYGIFSRSFRTQPGRTRVRSFSATMSRS